MTVLGKCLVADDSRLVQAVLREILRPHCASVLVAGGGREAIELMRHHPDVELLISDIHMPDGDGFSIVDALVEPRPFVVLSTARPTPEIERMALERGVVLLPKPLAIGDILRAVQRLKAERTRTLTKRSPRTRILAHVFVLDDESGSTALMSNELRDLSETGALIETAGPLAVGTRLHLSIEVRELKADVRAEVVRVQEPRWGVPGGVGVYFENLNGESAATFKAMIERYGLQNG